MVLCINHYEMYVVSEQKYIQQCFELRVLKFQSLNFRSGVCIFRNPKMHSYLIKQLTQTCNVTVLIGQFLVQCTYCR